MQSCRATEIEGNIRYLIPFEVTYTLKIQGLVESKVGVHILPICASCASLFFHSWMPILSDSFCLCGIYSSGVSEGPHFLCSYGIIKFGKLCITILAIFQALDIISSLIMGGEFCAE